VADRPRSSHTARRRRPRQNDRSQLQNRNASAASLNRDNALRNANNAAPVRQQVGCTRMDGAVYEKDLGPSSASIAGAMTRFDPDPTRKALPAP
jgi:hypothetical protein